MTTGTRKIVFGFNLPHPVLKITTVCPHTTPGTNVLFDISGEPKEILIKKLTIPPPEVFILHSLLTSRRVGFLGPGCSGSLRYS
jgi:hypothetical protein